MARRQDGEGPVYQRGRQGGRGGQWVAVANLGWRRDATGTLALDRREFTAPTRGEAVRRRQWFLDRRRDGFTLPKGQQLFVGDWMMHWLHNVARREVEATTWDRSYRQKVEALIVPYFERVPLAELREEDVEEWHAKLERVTSARTGKPLSPSTVAQAHRIFSRALKVAVARGSLPRNPCQNVSPPARPRAELQVPSAAEVARILERCGSWPNGARWVVALKTGLRQGEALALRWADVKLTGEPSVTVRQSAARTSEGLTYKQPKSAKSRRTVPLTYEAVQALKAHRTAQGVADIGGLVFTRGGKPWHPRADYADWHALLDDLGIRHYRVHDCRHAVATMLLDKGVDSRIVQEILGHATPAFTQQIYQHVRPALMARALDALDG